MLVDKNKVSAPKREDLINMLMSAWKNIKIDFAAVFMKKLHVNNALDGSEDRISSSYQFVKSLYETHSTKRYMQEQC